MRDSTRHMKRHQECTSMEHAAELLRLHVENRRRVPAFLFAPAPSSSPNNGELARTPISLVWQLATQPHKHSTKPRLLHQSSSPASHRRPSFVLEAPRCGRSCGASAGAAPSAFGCRGPEAPSKCRGPAPGPRCWCSGHSGGRTSRESGESAVGPSAFVRLVGSSVGAPDEAEA